MQCDCWIHTSFSGHETTTTASSKTTSTTRPFDSNQLKILRTKCRVGKTVWAGPALATRAATLVVKNNSKMYLHRHHSATFIKQSVTQNQKDKNLLHMLHEVLYAQQGPSTPRVKACVKRDEAVPLFWTWEGKKDGSKVDVGKNKAALRWCANRRCSQSC